MILQIFSIFDDNVKAFMPPFFVNHRGEATRGFTELANDPKTNICKYAQDFYLFELGVFDNSNGEFTLLTNPNSLGCALTYRSTASGGAPLLEDRPRTVASGGAPILENPA